MRKRRNILAGIVIAVVALAASFASAETVRHDMDFKDFVRFHQATSVESGGSLDIESGGSLKIAGTVVSSSAAELNIVDGVTATAAELNAAADLSARTTTASLTNGAALTLSASTPVVILSGIGGADDTTNTFTIATPYPLYSTFTLVANSATTNLLLLADSTTVVAIGADWLADGTDSIVLFAAATNSLVKVGGNDN